MSTLTTAQRDHIYNPAHKITPRFKELSPFRQAVINKLINAIASEPDTMLRDHFRRIEISLNEQNAGYYQGVGKTGKR
jgi:hypothetical protein